VAVLSQVRTLFADRTPPVTVAADGTFKLTVARAELALYLGAGQGVAVVALADGFGLAWRSAGAFLPAGEPGGGRTRDPVLRLVKDDAPLSGQVKTLEGKPAAGARVELYFVGGNDRGDLKPRLKAVGRGRGSEVSGERLDRFLIGPGLERIGTTTDADGRFRLSGVGRGRLAALRVWGPSSAHACVLARTEPGEKVLVPGISGAVFPGADGCYGQEMALQLAPSRPVEGVVTDVETGAPLVGAIIQSQKFAGVTVIVP